jgi:hypothetical protein
MSDKNILKPLEVTLRTNDKVSKSLMNYLGGLRTTRFNSEFCSDRDFLTRRGRGLFFLYTRTVIRYSQDSLRGTIRFSVSLQQTQNEGDTFMRPESPGSDVEGRASCYYGSPQDSGH